MQPRKLEFIDTLRGLAALYVLCFHLSLITSPKAMPPDWLFPIINAGGSGVMLFFIVSAFTLCLSMEARATGESEPVTNFYIRRFFRIAPLFYTWLIIYYVRDAWHFHTVHPLHVVAENVTFLFNLFPGQEDGYVWASWTIGVEMLFYALFPLIFFYARSLGIALAFCLFGMAIRLPFHTLCQHLPDPAAGELFYEHGFVFNLAVFLAGIVVYHIYKLMDPPRARRLGAGYALVAVFVTFLIYECYEGLSPDRTLHITYQTFFYSALLLGLSLSPIKLIVNRITRFYGKISYSVYLSHATTVFFMSPIFARVYHHMPYKTVAFGISVALALAVITPLSYLTYRFIELPGNALGRHIIRRIAGPRLA